jgi:release factor glutamine methyltransferase
MDRRNKLAKLKESCGQMETVLGGPVERQELAIGHDPFRPSDYTGMLIHALRLRATTFGHGSGLDMGVGSGVLLGTLGLLGIDRLCGVDIDPAAIQATEALMREMGLLERTRLLLGSLWEPVGDERFDIVVANLPHFAATEPSDPDHSPYWSMGGPDGRLRLDPFLAGLGAHLKDDGVAFITHNAFVGSDRTAAMLAEQGLVSRSVLSTTVALHPAKTILLQPEVRERFMDAGISRVGPYEFADVHILEIRRG